MITAGTIFMYGSINFTQFTFGVKCKIENLSEVYMKEFNGPKEHNEVDLNAKVRQNGGKIRGIQSSENDTVSNLQAQLLT